VAEIDVIKKSETDTELAFDVTVRDQGASAHAVTLSRSDYDRLAYGSEQPEQFIERCFGFLLQREPKESILPTFDVSAIATYFPEFEQEIQG
jgi:hypothetical protein